MQKHFETPTGIRLEWGKQELDYPGEEAGLEALIGRLDREKGAYFSSGVEYPGRYSRWDFGFVAPPLEIVARGRLVWLNALSPRGVCLLDILAPAVEGGAEVRSAERSPRSLAIEIAPSERPFAEEERSRQPSAFSPIRRIIGEFSGAAVPFLGLYGAFGYDLLFQFEPMERRLARPAGAKDLHLFLPDSIEIIDRRLETAARLDFAFARDGVSTVGASAEPFVPMAACGGNGKCVGAVPEIISDHADEEYAAKVEAARRRMIAGDVFEVVLSRRFSAPFAGRPSSLFRKMRRINPSPYEFFIQLGDEQLVGASPEMFVRVEGDRVESCPIAGTIRRGANAMEDADRIRALYDSKKDEAELTMCTDVDRNDKARICEPGSVRLLDRRLIERYAGLFHTVDHVEGRLRPGFSGIDAFLSHMWAVTLTGAPKRMAARIIEAMENEPRGWYGGAVGMLGMDGGVNTGITIRTIHIHDGRADYRAGASLVYDSVGAEEERETRTKATAFFRIMGPADEAAPAQAAVLKGSAPGRGRKILMIDHDDSFVHTLADYFRQTGAEVRTYRWGIDPRQILDLAPDLVVHSPGPGRPADFELPDLVRLLAGCGVPQFGVCLGLQGMAEAFGGRLALLSAPRHGKVWEVTHRGGGLFRGLPSPFRAGAYHSLYAARESLPGELEVTAWNGDGLVMGLRHRRLPLAAVQFHPESILTMENDLGLRLMANVVEELASKSTNESADQTRVESQMASREPALTAPVRIS